jgi:hypothetical protein
MWGWAKARNAPSPRLRHYCDHGAASLSGFDGEVKTRPRWRAVRFVVNFAGGEQPAHGGVKLRAVEAGGSRLVLLGEHGRRIRHAFVAAHVPVFGIEALQQFEEHRLGLARRA